MRGPCPGWPGLSSQTPPKAPLLLTSHAQSLPSGSTFRVDSESNVCLSLACAPVPLFHFQLGPLHQLEPLLPTACSVPGTWGLRVGAKSACSCPPCPTQNPLIGSQSNSQCAAQGIQGPLQPAMLPHPELCAGLAPPMPPADLQAVPSHTRHTLPQFPSSEDSLPLSGL